MSSPAPDSLVLSYLGLRKAIGVLGLGLPAVLALGGMLLDGPGLEASISSYYYTGMRDVLVGTLSAIAVFMLSYRGYDRRDRLAGDFACVFALGVALLPTTPDAPSDLQRLVGRIHLASAAAFFLTLSYFSLILFTKTDPARPPTARKLQRNRVYRTCGYIMLAAIGLIVLHAALPTAALDRLAPVFWLEAAAVVAFGVSWLTKGEAILKDGL